MSYLINRTPTGRLISLITEVKYLAYKFGNNPFTLNDMKFDRKSEKTQLDFFPYTENHSEIGKYDPYLNNPLSEAGFHLTQGKQYDSQKSKSVSECMNALEGLGWAAKLTNRENKLTENGLELCELDFNNPIMFNFLKKSVLRYGPFYGFLYKCKINESVGRVINRSKIDIGYIKTNELVNIDGRSIPLSTGSEKDSIVRTRSTMFAWAMTTGFVWPNDLSIPRENVNWYQEACELLRQKTWNWSKYISSINDEIFNGGHYVDKPLNYLAMTKSTKALRERGQESVRQISLKLENIVKNRRFAIVYSLAVASINNKQISLNSLITELKNYESLYVVERAGFKSIIEKELDIAILAGIPYIKTQDIVKPLSKINIEELKFGAPLNLIENLDEIYQRIIV